MVASADGAVWAADLLGAEREQVVEAFNATAVEYPVGHTLQAPFEAQAERTPEAVAVAYEDRSWTYRELDERSNQLGHWLQAQGVGPDTVVGVLAERSLELVGALYGVLKAGGAYLPLDPEAPDERRAAILADSGVEVVLTQAHLADRLGDWPGRRLALDTEWEAEVGGLPQTRPAAVAGPRHWPT